jgi:eukaryotic-like serine/threonine-protein kinase
MAIISGTKLGPYEILSLVGVGGMGEVYRARDTRLERTVAIKVLPSHLSNNAEARKRFDREARAISALNHPHVCTLYDVGHQDGVDFLVMEFLDGQTLGHRLTRGPLPVGEVLQYAVEICGGLEKAHRRGVIHRDLKPGNIMLTRSGVKLMDFGLAKSMRQATLPCSGLSETLALSAQPQPLTAEGVVLGTFHYMSPEQVEGKEADARSDIFALGAVLYEMVTGNRAFSGKTTAAVMAAVLERDPEPISTSNPECPPTLERTIRLCLAKDPDERWQSVHDLKLDVQGTGERLGALDVGSAAPFLRNRGLKLWALLASLFLTSAGYFLGQRFLAVPRTSPPVRALLLPPKGFTFSPYMYALSPDGKRIAFVATSDAKLKGLLWVQNLDSMTATPLPGIEDVASSGYPFWSPDSTAIGFFSGGKLKRVDANGGVPVSLANAQDAHGGTWSQDGFIVFSRAGAITYLEGLIGVPPFSGKEGSELLYRIPATGGLEESITAADNKHLSDIHRWPSFLPGGHHVLLRCYALQEFHRTEQAGTTGYESGCIADSNLNDQSPSHFTFGEMRPDRVLPHGQYANGQLLSVGNGNLVARPFNLSKMAFTGDERPIAAKIKGDEILGANSFSVSPAGVLAYMTEEKFLSQLAWYSRLGKVIEKVEPAGTYDGVALSPNGQHVATSLSDSSDVRCLWMEDVHRGTISRFGEQCAKGRLPLWSGDGSKVAFASSDPQGDIYVTPSTGLEEQEFLFEKLSGGTVYVPTDFSPDGHLLLYVKVGGGHESRLWVHPYYSKGQKDHELMESDYPQSEAHFSPDGRWLAYVSEENGRPEVYVLAFPSLSSKVQISSAGGSQPRWRRDVKELFFIAPDGTMMAVPVEAKGSTFKAETPEALFRTQIVAHGFYQYDVSADGQTFIINTRATEQGPPPITILINWETELKR